MRPLNKPLSLLLVLSTALYLAFAAGDIACTISTEDGQEVSDCPALHSCIHGFCRHKNIFPLTIREYVGTFLLTFIAGLANAGGLGGGALLSPILLIIFNYSPNKAIMIVYSIVFGGSLGNFLNVAFQRNPATGKSFVDYDLTLICMPLMILGANVGVVLNRIFPPLLVLVGLVAVMMNTGKKVFEKAKKTYAAETNKQQQTQQPLLNKSPGKQKGDLELTVLGNNRSQNPEDNDDGIPMSLELNAVLEEDKELFPREKLRIIGAMLVFSVFVMILRGSKNTHSPLGVEYCETGYWLIFILGLAGCYAFYRKGLKVVQSRLEIKRQYGYDSNDSGFSLTTENVKKIGWLSVVTGIAAGLLGLGGGMIMSPILLQLGMEPQILAATVGFFVVQTSFITLFQSFYVGDVTGKETLFFMSVAFLGSIGVSMVLNYFIKKYKRPSIMLFALTSVIFLSLVVMPAFGVYKSIDNPSQMLVSNSIC